MRLSRQFFVGLLAGCLLTFLVMAGLDKSLWNNDRSTPPLVAGGTLPDYNLPDYNLSDYNLPGSKLAGSNRTGSNRTGSNQASDNRTGGTLTSNKRADGLSAPLEKSASPSGGADSTVEKQHPAPEQPPAQQLATAPVREQAKKSRKFPSFPLPETVSSMTYADHSMSINRAERMGMDQAPKGPMFKSTPSKFSFHCMGTGDGPTLLVIGGIQGDEPGGFSAASLLSTHYTITRGNLWIVPDLNYASIVKRNRGLFGDMNRKFAHLPADDPEYTLVQGIKKILLADEVDLILNLHDGSGFYCPTWVNKLRNPNRWGQSVIIDKVEMDAPRFNKLHHMASLAEKDANKALVHPDHRYFIRNTNTHLGDKEMEKSLSWFAVLNGKPAFGVEASKEFTTEYRSYYHMLIVESFMRQMGIEFERNFDLSPQNVLVALNSGITLSLYDGKIVLPLDDVRPQLNNIPFANSAPPEHQASRPLLSLVKEKGDWRVAYGNRTLTRIAPETMPFDHSLRHINISVDGKPAAVDFGAIVPVQKDFMIHDIPGYRVNAIGATREVNGTEAGVTLQQADFMQRFSVDKKGLLYRVEVYKDDAFCGMVLVDFGTSYQPASLDIPLTAVKGEESELGY